MLSERPFRPTFIRRNVVESGDALMFKRWSDGAEGWFRDGLLHRTAGPAYTHPDGKQEWWVNDKQYERDSPEHKLAILKHLSGR